MALGEIIAAERETILSRWEDQVRRSNSASAHFSQADLRDDVPQLLERLSSWLDTDSTDTRVAVAQETSGKHALHRLRQGVELRHLIDEYRLLRQIVLRVAFSTGPQTAALANDVLRFDDAIDHAMSESVATYASTRDDAREIMLAILAHDLRNPLSAILMSAGSLLKSGALREVESRTVSRIARSAERIKHLIADLLDVARSRFGGKMPISRASLNLGDVVSNAVEELQLTHPERSISCEIHGDLRGEWDRDRMAQLASNLVANAIQHGRDPVTCVAADRNGEVTLVVTNRGAPIPPEAQATLFEPFRRPVKADERQGMGLGLYIVAEIVRAHGGTVTVESGDDRTSFIVRLPRRC